MIINNRFVTLFMCILFGAYTFYYWNDATGQFLAGLNLGFFLWSFLQTLKEFAVYYSRKRGGHDY